MQESEDRRPIFIVSSGRSGSTMIARVLAEHPNLLSLHEPHPHLNVEAFSMWRGTRNDARIRSRVDQKRSWLIEQAQWNDATYVESAHYTAHLILTLNALYDARFIYLHRDGRDFVRSGLERDWWYPESYSDVFRRSKLGGVWELEILQRLRRFFLLDVGFSWNDHRLVPPTHLDSRLEKISWLWVEINDLIIDQLRDIEETGHTSVALEELSEDTLGDLLTFVGAAADSVLLDEMLETAGRRPNKTADRSVPPFEEWPESGRESFWEIAGGMMERLGYASESKESQH